MKTEKKKAILLLATLLALTFLSATVETPGESEDGIHFFKGTWTEALEKSRNENKPIFLDVFATWCGPCKMLKRNTFSDKKVGDYFNTHYINVSLDGEQAEGRRLMLKYNLRAYPSLVIVDGNENAKVIDAGYKSPGGLIDFGKRGLQKLK